MADYGYERLDAPIDGIPYAIWHVEASEHVAKCYHEEHAKAIVDALNPRLSIPLGSAAEACERYGAAGADVVCVVERLADYVDDFAHGRKSTAQVKAKIITAVCALPEK